MTRACTSQPRIGRVCFVSTNCLSHWGKLASASYATRSLNRAKTFRGVAQHIVHLVRHGPTANQSGMARQCFNVVSVYMHAMIVLSHA